MDCYIEEALTYLGKDNFPFVIETKEAADPTLLHVKKENGKATIEYGQRASLFYGLTLLKLNKAKENYEEELHRHFKTNGLMHDCSRNGAINIEQAKQMILVSALFGLNRFLFYIEDLYNIPEEPFFGYFRGRYTKAEIAPLLEYAKGFGVEIIPCIQTLSHLNAMLKWAKYKDILDSDRTIRPDKERTYELIERMLKAAKDIFQTNKIHIGMDEAADLGRDRYMFDGIVIDKKAEFLAHLNRVSEICKRLDIEPFMWGDMFFQLDMGQTGGHWYGHEGPLKDDVKKLIPDVGLVYWDYYNKDINVYKRHLKTLKDTGHETYFAGGAISWIGFAPNIVQSNEITTVGLKAALAEKIDNVFTTSWGDDGNECSVVAPYPTLAIHSLY